MGSTSSNKSGAGSSLLVLAFIFALLFMGLSRFQWDGNFAGKTRDAAGGVVRALDSEVRAAFGGTARSNTKQPQSPPAGQGRSAAKNTAAAPEQKEAEKSILGGLLGDDESDSLSSGDRDELNSLLDRVAK
ncbi:MAG: hypothetical protein K1X83_12060 [Oligoflexia bacterium]|nr:hypothetical protein [Oligoflexia bacterium]